MANPSWYYCTGPIYTWVSFDSASVSPYYLGTAEQFPVVEGEHAWSPVWNDLGGPAVPSERQFHGKKLFVSIDLNRFSQSILDAVLATPRQGEDGLPWGTNSYLDRGAFLVQNKLGFSLWMIFSFYGTANVLPGMNMPPGIYLPYCMLTGDYQDRQGTQNKKHRLVIEAQEFRLSNGGQFLGSTALADMASLNGVIPE